MNVVIVGRGSLGTVFARVLRAAGADVTTLAGRRRPRTNARVLEDATLVLLAVPDPVIAEVSSNIAPLLGRTCVVLHAAGARTSTELAAVRARGLHAGVVHPMVSFAAGTKPTSLAGTTFVCSGDPGAVRAARKLAKLAGARFVRADVHGATYHAAAALVANGAVGLAWAAVDLLVARGIAKRDAERALSGLLATVARNLGEVGVPDALTGPIARGDAETVTRHRDALAHEEHREALVAYDGIGPTILACSVARGLDEPHARAVAAALSATPRRPRATRSTSRAPRARPSRSQRTR